MNDVEWRMFLSICRRMCGEGAQNAWMSQSWCAFTAFGSFQTYCSYWKFGFPGEKDLAEDRVIEGGVWRQDFHHSHLAHIIIPARFRWEAAHTGKFEEGYRLQDIDRLSSELQRLRLPHRKIDIILELRLY